MNALRLAGRLWLHEVTEEDVARLREVPTIGPALERSLVAQKGPAAPKGASPAPLDLLAAEHQRLLGFAIPPYESLYIDPSGMMMAPATARLVARYRHAGWQEPADTRAAAPDHLGVELLALADLWADGHVEDAMALHREHLALWAPAFLEAFGQADPPPLYAALAELTLELLLRTLPAANDAEDGTERAETAAVQFPDLPPAPRYRGTGMAIPTDDGAPFSVGLGGITSMMDIDLDQKPTTKGKASSGDVDVEDARELRLRDLVRRLLLPREAGLWLGRTDVRRLAGRLDLPMSIGDRAAMLESLLRSAGQHDEAGAAFDALLERLDEARATYTAWSDRWPTWRPIGAAWLERVARTRMQVESWRRELAAMQVEQG